MIEKDRPQVGEEVMLPYGGKLQNKTHKKERGITDEIEENIVMFCADILEDEYVSHKREKRIYRAKFGKNLRRVDLYVKCVNSDYAIEIKNPSAAAENTSAIGQILNYGRYFLDPPKKLQLVILTTFFDQDTAMTIDHYNLPIRYIYYGDGQSMEWVGWYTDDEDRPTKEV
jgi:hypothetical protein